MGRSSIGKEDMPQGTNRQCYLRLWLQHEIAEGRFLPGDRLEERAICERFGVSRTPVREALLQLASAGWVQFRPRYGVVVTRMSVKQVVAMCEVMAGLEALSAELATRRMTTAERERLKSIHEASRRCLETGDVPTYDAANRELHEAIYSGARNGYLEQLVKDIRRRLRPYRRYPFQRPGGMKLSFAGHQAVVDAILAGDERRADAEMRTHITAGGHAFADIVAELPRDLSDETEAQEESRVVTLRRAQAQRSKKR
jgi:DNA-binding GntR family transcriptional regulator